MRFYAELISGFNAVKYRPVGRTITRLSLEREVYGLNLGPVKSHTVLPTTCHRYNISAKEAVFLGRNGPGQFVTGSGAIQRV